MRGSCFSRLRESGSFRAVQLLVVLTLAGLHSGCDYIGESDGPSTDVSGAWSYSDSRGVQSTWTLVQDGDGVLSGAGTEGERVYGSLSRDAISLTSTNSGSLSILMGTVTGDTMAGRYTNTVSGVGSWAAVKTP